MDITIFSKKYRIKAHEADINNSARINVLFNIMQDAAAEHERLSGSGLSALGEKNLSWIVNKVRIEIKQKLTAGCSFTLSTAPTGFHKFYYIREFVATNDNGIELFKANTAWLTINKTTGRIVKPEQLFQNRKFPLFPVQTPVASKFSKSVSGEKTGSREVYYSDIDFNNHVNNAKYIEYFQDNLSANGIPVDKIEMLEIEYRSALKTGDSFDLFIEQTDENKYETAITKKDCNSFLCKAAVTVKS